MFDRVAIMRFDHEHLHERDCELSVLSANKLLQLKEHTDPVLFLVPCRLCRDFCFWVLCALKGTELDTSLTKS